MLSSKESCVLARDTCTFEEILTNKQKAIYTYEISLYFLNSLERMLDKNFEESFALFQQQEQLKQANNNLDFDCNIRDIYSLEKHFSNIKEFDKYIFEQLNDFILNFDSRLYRKVTKKVIVYRKDKMRNIVKIIIRKSGGVKVYLSSKIINLDMKFFSVVLIGNKGPLDMMMEIACERDLDYLKTILKDYFYMSLKENRL